MQDLLFSKKFGEYRKLELEAATNFAVDLFKDGMNPEYVKGAMAMLKKVLHLPISFAKTKEAKEMASNLVTKDLKEFEAKFIRLFVK